VNKAQPVRVYCPLILYCGCPVTRLTSLGTVLTAVSQRCESIMFRVSSAQSDRLVANRRKVGYRSVAGNRCLETSPNPLPTVRYHLQVTTTTSS
jgi:hypothetical protein